VYSRIAQNQTSRNMKNFIIFKPKKEVKPFLIFQLLFSKEVSKEGRSKLKLR
jgi:hypothetical protein